jgi:hypothetical protein
MWLLFVVKKEKKINENRFVRVQEEESREIMTFCVFM